MIFQKNLINPTKNIFYKQTTVTRPEICPVIEDKETKDMMQNAVEGFLI